MVLIAEGATDETLVQLKNVLHLPDDLTHLRAAYNDIQHRLQTNTTSIELTVNHALFSNINYIIDNKYIDTLSKIYRVEHVPVNFQIKSDAATTINDYISIRTQGRIKNIVHPEDLIDIQLLLSSSIFFRGQWKVCSTFFSSSFAIFHFIFISSTRLMPTKLLSNHFIEKTVTMLVM